MPNQHVVPHGDGWGVRPAKGSRVTPTRTQAEAIKIGRERADNQNSELFIHGDGTQVRDFLYVEDAARSAKIVAERGALEGEVYNVGAGK